MLTPMHLISTHSHIQGQGSAPPAFPQALRGCLSTTHSQERTQWSPTYSLSFLAHTSTGTAYSDLLSQSFSPFPGYKTYSLEFGVDSVRLVEKQSPFI